MSNKLYRAQQGYDQWQDPSSVENPEQEKQYRLEQYNKIKTMLGRTPPEPSSTPQQELDKQIAETQAALSNPNLPAWAKQATQDKLNKLMQKQRDMPQQPSPLNNEE